MYGKTHLELKPERLRRNVGMCGGKDGKILLELKKIASDEDDRDRSPIFTDCWDMVQRPQVETRPTDQSASELKLAEEDIPSLEKEEICWYCYEKYSEMCIAQGINPSSVNSQGIWRGHCMKDEKGITTCPHLWFTKCDRCGATAAEAHTDLYCPMLMLNNLSVDST